MNLGGIPGYYYDKEKKKYFKIQANHVAPSQDIKYTRSNVKQEQRKTVKRSPVLQHPASGGIGLSREHGFRSTTQILEQRDAAVISQWRPQCVRVRFPDTQMLIASTHTHTGVSAVHVCSFKFERSDFKIPSGCGLTAFHSGVVSISTVEDPGMGARTVICATRTNEPGSIFMGSVPPLDNHQADPHIHGLYVRASRSYGSLLSCSINRATGSSAILGTRRISILDSIANPVSSPLLLEGDEDAELGPSIDWLTPNTVAYSYNRIDRAENCVMLWDVRTKHGISARFKLQGRITGVLNPFRTEYGSGKGGHQLLVSTNHSIDLLDTRMHAKGKANDLALLSFPHVHQGPELEYTTIGSALVAAVDRDNLVQIYSLRSGRLVQSLIKPDFMPSRSESRIMKSLQWYEDEEFGSTLQACLGNSIVGWTWQDSTDDQ